MTKASVFATLLPTMAVVVVAYLVTGIAMPVLPIHVHDGLGLGTFVVGLVAGTQFAATLVSRLWAGHYADTKGSKPAVLIGLCYGVAAGAAYLISARFSSSAATSVMILIVGRALLGVMESFVITGALSWGVGLAGRQNAGKVMVWIGLALFTAFAIGAPIGSALYSGWGFAAIGLATLLLPLATFAVVVPQQRVEPHPDPSPPLKDIVRAIWMPGVALALSGIGFAAIITFVPLLFAERGWSHAWLAFTSFSAAFMAARALFGHLPDRIGGAKVASACMLVEAAGLAIIWRAPGFSTALAGITLTGLGYSLVFPGLGVEAIHLTPPQSRGVTMGTYTAFLDLALGIASPALGLIAATAGLQSVFLVSTVITACTAALGFFALYSRSQVRRFASS